MIVCIIANGLSVVNTNSDNAIYFEIELATIAFILISCFYSKWGSIVVNIF